MATSPLSYLCSVATLSTNATSGPDVGKMIEDLVEVVVEAEPRFPTPWAPRPEADPALLALTGPWYWGAAPFALKLLGDRHLELVTLGSRGRQSRFRPEVDGTWTGLGRTPTALTSLPLPAER